MAVVAVSLPRAAVFDTPEGLLINIPSKRNWFLILFIGFWLCGWTWGEAAAIHQLLTGKTNGAALFIFGWVGAWTVGGAVAFAAWAWNLAGHEIVKLTPTEFAIRREVLGFGPSREYVLSEVKNLRVDPAQAGANTLARNSFSWWGGGTIAFDYGAKTYRFGGGIDEAEAAQLIQRLQSRHQFDAAD